MNICTRSARVQYLLQKQANDRLGGNVDITGSATFAGPTSGASNISPEDLSGGDTLGQLMKLIAKMKEGVGVVSDTRLKPKGLGLMLERKF